MSFYIERVFCKGVVPSGIPSFNYERRELISKLLCAKDKPRAIVAPSGYGKTALCASYAQTIYSFKDTVWFDCASPCFLRDLDADRLEDPFLEEEDIQLCVFDELPKIPDILLEKFEKLISFLASTNVEVLINCASEARNEFLNDSNYFKLSAKDLLVVRNDIDTVPAVEYPNGEASNLFESIRRYGLYRNEMLVYYCALMLQQGTFDEIENFFHKRWVRRSFEEIESFMPHVRVDFSKRTFKCIALSVEDIKVGFSFAIDEIIESSRFENSETFFQMMTKALVKKGEWQRAKEVALKNFKLQERLRWALDNASAFSDRHQAQNIIECLSTSSQQMSELRDEIHVCLCHLFCEMGSFQNAINCATKVLSSRKSTNSMKGYVALLACFICNEERMGDYEETMIEFMGANDEGCYFDKPFASLKFSQSDINFLKDFIVVWHQDTMKGLIFLMNRIDEYNDKGIEACSEAAYCFCAGYVLRTILNEGKKKKSLLSALKKVFITQLDNAEVQEMIGCLICFCFDCLRLNDYNYLIPFEVLEASSVALEVCEELCSDYLRYTNLMIIEVIKDHRKRNEKSKYYSELSWVKINSPIIDEMESMGKNSREMIKLSYFGGFAMEIDNQRAACSLAKRKNCVYFLFLLSENIGKYMTRDLITEKIWPDHMSPDSARRSFYNALSQIKTAINGVTDTEFLRKNGSGYYLDPDCCSSDLQEFTTFCNYLNFNVENVTKNMTLVADRIVHFSMPLLPQITKIPRINDLRITFKSQLADALVLASISCLEIKDFRDALWFARKAKDIDHNREDAYYLIMKAQSGLNLRSSAVSTFFECKNILDQELGIMPSSEIRNLYQTVIS